MAARVSPSSAVDDACIVAAPQRESAADTHFGGGISALASYAHSDRLLMGSPLRRRGVCLVTTAVLLVVLAFATLVHLGLIRGMRADDFRRTTQASLFSQPNGAQASCS